MVNKASPAAEASCTRASRANGPRGAGLRFGASSPSGFFGTIEDSWASSTLSHYGSRGATTRQREESVVVSRLDRLPERVRWRREQRYLGSRRCV